METRWYADETKRCFGMVPVVGYINTYLVYQPHKHAAGTTGAVIIH